EMRTSRVVARGREGVQDAECFEHGRALCRRRQLEDVEVAEARHVWITPLPRVGREVVRRKVTAGCLHRLRDGSPDRASVEGVGSVVGEYSQRARRRGLAEVRPGLDGAVLRGPGLVLAEPWAAVDELARAGLAHRVAVVGQRDGGARELA